MKVTAAPSLQSLKGLRSWLQRPARRQPPMTTLEWVRLAPELTNEIAADDALIEYLVQNPDVTKVDRLPVESPAVRALRDAGVNIEMMNQGSSEISMMFGVRSPDRDRAVRALYQAFFT